jgi:hypothetical protein
MNIVVSWRGVTIGIGRSSGGVGRLIFNLSHDLYSHKVVFSIVIQ